jgi:hypothetical protein
MSGVTRFMIFAEMVEMQISRNDLDYRRRPFRGTSRQYHNVPVYALKSLAVDS